MFGTAPKPGPDWEPPVGGSIAEPLVPRLIVLFGLRACRFESFPFDVQLPRIESGRIVLPADEPGISPWSLDLGVELPVRYRGLTLGRYVLVPASPTTGVDFSPASRTEAISMVVPVGARIAEAIVAESHGTVTRRSAEAAAATSSGSLPSTVNLVEQPPPSDDGPTGRRSHRRAGARRLRRTARRGGHE